MPVSLLKIDLDKLTKKGNKIFFGEGNFITIL